MIPHKILWIRFGAGGGKLSCRSQNDGLRQLLTKEALGTNEALATGGSKVKKNPRLMMISMKLPSVWTNVSGFSG